MRSQVLHPIAIATTALVAMSPALATPVMNGVTTTYSSSGVPVSITIAGTGLCAVSGANCSAVPTVKMGGNSATVSSYSKTAVTIVIPAGFASGSYEINLTAGNSGSDQFWVAIANVATQGPAGPAGPAGPTGAAGPAGPAGATGTMGPQGIPGPSGPAGATGSVGATGATGAQGPAGPQGATGATGSQGPQGAAGTNGPGFNFRGPYVAGTVYAVNDVVTEGGSTFVAANPGPSQDPANDTTDWALMAQAGAAGAAGSPGPQGAPGSQGAVGPAGPAGQAGAVGGVGPQGPAGPMGTAGQTGPAGAAGATGATGATGPAGPPGPQGIQGPQGAQGPAGNAGSGTSLVVVDSNAKVLGGYIVAGALKGYQTYVMVNVGGIPVGVAIFSNGDGTLSIPDNYYPTKGMNDLSWSTLLYFPTTDCSGPAYVTPSIYGFAQGWQFGGLGYAPLSFASITSNSTESAGVCTAGGGKSGVLGEVQQIALPSYQGPFTIGIQ